MSLDTLFAMVVPVYLVLVAYGQVGTRRRRLPGRTRALAAALRVVLLPAALLAALWSTGDAVLLRQWGVVALGMMLAGATVALLVEAIAPKLGA